MHAACHFGQKPKTVASSVFNKNCFFLDQNVRRYYCFIKEYITIQKEYLILKTLSAMTLQYYSGLHKANNGHGYYLRLNCTSS